MGSHVTNSIFSNSAQRYCIRLCKYAGVEKRITLKVNIAIL